MEKRGELTSQQIAILVLAIGGFILVFLFLFAIFDNNSLTDRELCRLSILERATLPAIAQSAVPLQCTTEKICITLDKSFFKKVGEKLSTSQAAIGFSDKSDCKQFAGEQNVRTVEVKMRGDVGEQAETLRTIEREVANAMYDCWAMTGQGKLDIWTGGADTGLKDKLIATAVEGVGLGVAEIKPHCIVCSRVAFSDVLIKEDENIGLLERLNYNTFIARELVPGKSISYLHAFTGESGTTGYGAISPSEELDEYFGKVLTPEEASVVKEVLKKQFKDKLGEIVPGKDVMYESYIEGLDVGKYLKDIEPVTSSKDNQLSVVFTQIKVPGVKPEDQYWDTFSRGAMVGTLGAFTGPGKIASYFIPGPGWMKAVIKLGGVGLGSLSLASSAESTTRTNQALSATVCGKFESKVKNADGSDLQQGCSLVKVINWDVNTVNNLCTGGIEGNL